MKQIPLTKGCIALVDDEDFDRISQFNWCVLEFKNIKYAVRNSPREKGKKRKLIMMHREILGVKDSKKYIDHKDHNGLNNQKQNLRPGKSEHNQYNRRASGASKYLGVCWDKFTSKWKAQISISGKNKYIGRYKTESEAAKAYDAEAKKHHGKFANLNFK